MIVMGRIVAPFGINGWLKVQVLGDDPLSWRKMPSWWIGKKPDSQSPGDWQIVKPKGLRVHGKGVILAIAEAPDRTAAEAIDGWYIAAPREALPAPAPDEFYWADLIGLRVVNTSGIGLGKVRSLIETGAHAVLEVEDGDIERLIPFVGVYVENVDLASGEIRVAWEADW